MPVSDAKQPSNILLVDDNKHGLSARKVVLQELGYRTTALTSPSDALEQICDSPFDLLITDYKMPKMDGITLIGEVRKKKPALPIILISGFVDSLGLNEESTGADVVIQKSANEITLLVRAVKRLLDPRMKRKPAGRARADQQTRKLK
jgi:CheY-like chemotaxis protein